MNLTCSTELAAAYRSASQIARVLSEDWCDRELYCPACDSDHLRRLRTNNPAVDFNCPSCENTFQLKSSRKWNPTKVADAAYGSMIKAIRADKTPHLILIQYTTQWCIQNVLLVPRTFITESVIEKRKPLGESARRHGWVGCNILLSGIPEDGKIPIVSAGAVLPEQRVRREFERVKGLAQLPPPLRGWAVDVLNLIRRLGRAEFSLRELYGAEPELQAAHPRNQNVRPKIRQQLQLLRDVGLLDFLGRGTYRLRGS